MKRIITILIFSISINVAYSQFDENNAIYSTGELNLGNYIGIDINSIPKNIITKLWNCAKTAIPVKEKKIKA